MRVTVIIPALNEEGAIGAVIDEIPRDLVGDVIVVDNGSSDRTSEVAAEHGARVVRQDQRGYGNACLAGMAAVDGADVVVFLDGDHSDYPEEIADLLSPIAADEADMVLGSRVLGNPEKGALTPQQVFGNRVACTMIDLFFGHRFSDLGPFRAVRWKALKDLGMIDRTYGWTVEMQVKALRKGLRVSEVPVKYRRRIGKSKVSGTLRGTLGAGYKIITTILRYAK